MVPLSRRCFMHATGLLVGSFAVDAPPAGAAVEGGGAPSGTPFPGAAGTYTNPVSDAFTENFADPTVIRGRDGYWYGYATGGMHHADDAYHRLSIARSRDLVTWEFVGDVFTAETEPHYDGKGTDARRMYWAPAVEYFGGRYLLYYSYVVNAGADRSWRAIGVATAPTPAGPWQDSGAAVVEPGTWEPWPGVSFTRSIIDPEVLTAPDGTRYLFYGSRGGGVLAARLSEDGLRTVGEPVQITPAFRYEAAHLVRREGYYYLFLSAIGGCCDGPASAYPVHVARSRDPLGPYVDHSGASVLAPNAGGTPVQAPNGNRWVSVGHPTMATDVSGQDWLVTHGIDRHDPYIQGFANARPLLISRLDWIDDWPTTRAGRWVPDGPAPAPVTEAQVADSFEGDDTPSDLWRPTGGWRVCHEPAGGYIHTDASGTERMLRSKRALHGDVRVRAAVRLGPADGGSAGFVLFDHAGRGVRVVIDRANRALVVAIRPAGRQAVRVAEPLPAAFRYDDWHELAVQVRGRDLHAEVSSAGLHDPVAVANARLPSGRAAGVLGLLAHDTPADLDDVTAAKLYTPVTEKVPDPAVGSLDAESSDEFAGSLTAGWQWVRDPAARVEGDQLVFPLQRSSLIDNRSDTDDTASMLLRTPPPGNWTVETRVTVPFGSSLPHGWPQAGLIVHADDDRYVLLTLSARGEPRWVTFGREMPWGSRVLYAWAALGPTADTMWLRLRHHLDPGEGEHHYRAATSADGEHWVWHGVYTLPADTPRVGLVAFDAAEDLTARFDYVRYYRP